MQKGESILNWQQREWAYDKWCLGYTQGQIAEALYCSTKTIRRAINGRPRTRPILVYDGEVEK